MKEAQAKLLQAERDLEQAKLNLRYCDVFAEIDGVVTRRNVNPGNNVRPAKADGRPILHGDLDRRQFQGNAAGRPSHRPAGQDRVDMYGSRQEFEGRITGFTMGTGQTLALLPPQNATGNFVKIVQRLPVRIELTSYDPDRVALFVGLSVTPYVYYQGGTHGTERRQGPAAVYPTSARRQIAQVTSDRRPMKERNP